MRSVAKRDEVAQYSKWRMLARIEIPFGATMLGIGLVGLVLDGWSGLFVILLGAAIGALGLLAQHKADVLLASNEHLDETLPFAWLRRHR